MAPASVGAAGVLSSIPLRSRGAPGAMRETPESLFKFFNEISVDAVEGEEDLEVHYASPSVVKRGREAARMLVAIQQLLGVKAAPAGAAAAPSGADAEKVAELAADLKESKAEIQRLMSQLMDQTKQNKALKDRVQLLQKQVERMHVRREMSKTLETIETKKLSKAERIGEGLPPEDADGPPAPGSDGDDASDPRATNKELQDELAVEAAARVPPEDDASKG